MNSGRRTPNARPWRRHDERGSALLAGTLLILAVTVTAGLGLVADGGRVLAERRHANAIAFQAARAGAEEVDPASLINGRPKLAQARAEATARATAAQLIADQTDLAARVVDVASDDQRVHVVIEITVPLPIGFEFGKDATAVVGQATVRAVSGITQEGN